MQRQDIKNAAQELYFLHRIIKENLGIFGDFLISCFYDVIDKTYFPTALKKANITPVFKKGKRYSKDNYRPTSILPIVSQTFEKCSFWQMSHYMDNFLSKH